MEIDNDLIQQWEPKIQKMISNLYIVGMDKDDLIQELRIAIIKAAKSFDQNREYKFHTYLHTTMINHIRTLISKEQKRRRDTNGTWVNEVSLQAAYPVHNQSSSEATPVEPEDPRAVREYQNMEMERFIQSKKLSLKEQKFLELRQDGMTMEEISKDLGESAYKVRQILREKFLDLADEYQLNL